MTTVHFTCIPDICFQPIVALVEGAGTCLEVLSSKPQEVMKLSPRVRHQHDLGALMLAANEVRHWREHPTLTLNISPYALTIGDFGFTLLWTLEVAGMEPSKLVIEVTETEPFDPGNPTVRNTINELRSHGVRFAVDDAGTRYFKTEKVKDLFSGIYCEEMTEWFSWIKISGEIIARLSEAEAEEEAEFLVQLAHDRGIEVVAEGVEDEWQLQKVRNHLGCDYAQGWHESLGRKLPAREFTQRMALAAIPAPR